MPNKNGTLQAREFIFYCEDTALAALPKECPRPERKVMWTILQLHYGNPLVHFEVQPHMGRGQVELGLHFEGPAEQNEAWALALSLRAVELMAALGPDWELEEWTASWRRLHRVFSFERLDAVLGRAVGAELCKVMQLLQPFAASCAEGYVAPTPVARPTRERRDWHRGRTQGKGLRTQ
jgi:hypothetical protein